MTDDQKVLLFSDKDLTSLDASILECTDVYGEGIPYQAIEKLDGTCYYWSDSMIYRTLLAMSCDTLSQFSEEELRMWNDFVNFEDNMSTSADSANEPDAAGCTIPDTNGDSFIVLSSGAITTISCEDALLTSTRENAAESLDTLLMNLYECEPINTCGIDCDFEQKYSCTEEGLSVWH